jgi:hypothetical protein
VSAVAPDKGESAFGLISSIPTPIGSELRPDKSGFLKLTTKGIAEDFAQDLSAKEIAGPDSNTGTCKCCCDEGRSHGSSLEVEAIVVHHCRERPGNFTRSRGVSGKEDWRDDDDGVFQSCHYARSANESSGYDRQCGSKNQLKIAILHHFSCSLGALVYAG